MRTGHTNYTDTDRAADLATIAEAAARLTGNAAANDDRGSNEYTRADVTRWRAIAEVAAEFAFDIAAWPAPTEVEAITAAAERAEVALTAARRYDRS